MPDPTTDTATLMAYREGKRPWHEIEPREAVKPEYRLPHPEIWGPVNEAGEECPWPWDPIQLGGKPIGQYHCPYCVAMVMAGQHHLDYIGLDEQLAADAAPEPFRTPGYDGPEGTEWPRPPHPDWHVWGNDTHYPPGGEPHLISRCHEGCPPKGQH